MGFTDYVKPEFISRDGFVGDKKYLRTARAEARRPPSDILRPWEVAFRRWPFFGLPFGRPEAPGAGGRNEPPSGDSKSLK